MLTSTKEFGFKAGPVLKALRSAAVMALPPEVSSAEREGDDEGGVGGEEEAVRGGGVGMLRMLSFGLTECRGWQNVDMPKTPTTAVSNIWRQSTYMWAYTRPILKLSSLVAIY